MDTRIYDAERDLRLALSPAISQLPRSSQLATCHFLANYSFVLFI